MNSILRYRLDRLRKEYQDDKIPWGLIESIPESETLITEMIIAKTYPILSIVMDYPVRKRNGRIYTKVSDLILSSDIDINLLSVNEREHLVLLAAYKLARRYIKRGHIGNMYKFMAGDLPWYYIREIKQELGTKEKNNTHINYYKEEIEDGNILLPSNPKEYMQILKNIGVSSYTKEYSFYNRTHLYKIMKKKD